MGLSLFENKGYPIEKQLRSWKEIVQEPISKLNDDAFTRVRAILMSSIEFETIRFSHSFSRINRDLQLFLAKLRRIDQHQATTINWLIGPDHSPLETTIAYEQTAIEVAATIAQIEPDPYLAQIYRYGLLEDFDHLYRYTALLDRLEGKDSNNILQSYTDILPGRPAIDHHRDAEDEIRESYDKRKAAPLTKMNALTILSCEQQAWNYYMNIGPLFSDPVARQLYAEIASIEEQHVTQYESIIDPSEVWMEKWLIHKANEVFNYYSCVQNESNSKVKKVWEQFLDFELGQFHEVQQLFKDIERRDPAEVLPEVLPEPNSYESQRGFIRETLRHEVDYRARGAHIFNSKDEESIATRIYRQRLHAEGVPSEIVALNYIWNPGGELSYRVNSSSTTRPDNTQKGAHI